MKHPGEASVQERLGVRVRPWGSEHVGNTIPPVAREFLGLQRMVILSARAAGGHLWVTALTGPPGFLRVDGGERIVVATRPAESDPLADAFDTERESGMLVLDPTTRRRMRINGTAQARDDRLVLQPSQVYANCPKYIQMREPFEPAPRPQPSVTSGTALTDEQQALIRSSDTFFLGTQADPYGADASHRGGLPGFVTVISPSRLSWPEYAGNRMYMTLGNLHVDPRAALLFIEWSTGALLHVTGCARTDWNPRRAAGTPGAQQTVDFEIERVVQTYPAHPLGWTLLEYSKFNPDIA